MAATHGTTGRPASSDDRAMHVEDFVTGMKDQAMELKDQAMELKQRYVDDTWMKTRDYVRQNPGKSILVSAAVGLVLGALLRRR